MDENKTEVDTSLEQTSSSSKERVNPAYKTLFMDHKVGDDIMVRLRSLRMRVESKICWINVKFDAKSQTNSMFASRVSNLKTNSTFSKKITKTVIGEALNLSKSLAINRSPET